MEYLSILSKEKKNIAKRIDKFLAIDDFRFDINYLLTIHKYLFKGVLPLAGNFREYNLSRKEEILNGESLVYADYSKIFLYLQYDFDNEQHMNYRNIDMDKLIKHISNFTLRIWLTHPFMDGNTRTISVFIQKYLKSLGYEINNNIFKKYGVFFRNALVCAGYYNSDLGIHGNIKYMMTFFRKLLVDEEIKLNNDDVYVMELFSEQYNCYKRTLKK